MKTKYDTEKSAWESDKEVYQSEIDRLRGEFDKLASSFEDNNRLLQGYNKEITTNYNVISQYRKEVESTDVQKIAFEKESDKFKRYIPHQS